jgi:hypothetical protein
MPGGLRQLGEVGWTSPMQEGAAAESSPGDAHVVQGLGPGPFLQGLFADRKQRRAAPLALGAHDTHAPLVLVAGAAAARHCLYDLDLFVVAADDQVADVDETIYAGVGAQAL